MIRIARQGPGFTSPTPARLVRLKADIRKHLMEGIRDYVRHRVRDQNLGEGRAPILGYSTRPLVVPWTGSLKPHRRPRGGTPVGDRGMFFPGGYLEYRRAVGLGDAFSFYNTGDAWRDWKVLLYGSEGAAGEIGFTKQENAIASSRAQDKRPDLFSVDESELNVLHTRVIEQINSTFFPAPTG